MDNNKKDLQNATSEEIAKELVKLLYRKGANDIKLYEVTEDTSLTDYYVIATGRSNTHVKSLADDVEYELGESGVEARSMEGRDGWILIDFINVIVHIFDPASREFYHLERLQNAEHEVDIADLCTPEDEN